MKQVLVTALGLLSIVATAMYIVKSIPEETTLALEAQPRQYIKVTTVDIASGQHRSTIEGYGQVIPEETLTLTSQVSGVILSKAKNFRLGEQISKGDLLFRIDDSSYQVLLANAEKELANAQLSFFQEQRKHQRAQKEWKTSGIKEAPSPLALREPQFKAAKARLNAAQQAVEDTKQKLSNTNIHAPFDAIVSQSNVTTGSVVASGTSLGQIKSIETAEVHLQLTERDWQQLPSDLSALSVTIQSASDSDSGQQWAARASHLSLLVEQSTRMRNLILKIDSPLQQPEPLLIGSFIKVVIQGKSYSNSFVVSSSSITADGNIWYVKEGQLHRHKTQSLFQDIDAIGFEQGNLNQHITLVVKPLSSYVEGMQVLALSDSPQADDTDKLASNRILPDPATGDKPLKEVNDGQ
ncbi:efflux RND transporter periplasmic adaptor subunit [Vibrio sp. SNU_ST1]|uniref:efflux RND transporter periplasmic adaptor subunit n=1 Tax=Vibrio sp. SNU_ST1 TaxID=3064001 RepID=UPI00272D4EDD|nr:efflux RND transporter periplasmic adaptor subunit [Vibrio sp. SNU_ST1]WKY60565.1 efflux RND transporter periplasmic adaptor subunit [Vibrio sp. SNU_ST1]